MNEAGDEGEKKLVLINGVLLNSLNFIYFYRKIFKRDNKEIRNLKENDEIGKKLF